MIFLSYAKKNKNIVDDVYSALRKIGYDVFMDKPPSPYFLDGIPAGTTNFKTYLKSQIKKAELVIIFISQHTCEPGFKIREINWVLDFMNEKLPGRIYAIPVLMEQCEVPGLVVESKNLKKIQRYDYHAHGLQGLIRIIGSIVEPDTSSIIENYIQLLEYEKTSVKNLVRIYLERGIREGRFIVSAVLDGDPEKAIDFLKKSQAIELSSDSPRYGYTFTVTKKGRLLFPCLSKKYGKRPGFLTERS